MLRALIKHTIVIAMEFAGDRSRLGAVCNLQSVRVVTILLTFNFKSFVSYKTKVEMK